MRRALCAFSLAAVSIFGQAAGLSAEEGGPGKEKPAENVEPTGEDREVIGMMELLQLMELLKDMELLEGEPKAVSEEKQ